MNQTSVLATFPLSQLAVPVIINDVFQGIASAWVTLRVLTWEPFQEGQWGTVDWQLADSWPLASVALGVVASALLWLRPSFSARRSAFNDTGRGPLPPGPRPWPILGNLLDIVGGGPDLPYQTLAKLAQKYGPVMRIWLGPSMLSVVISSPEAAREVLREFDQACHSRPELPESAKIILYGGKSLATAPAGAHLKLVRKLCATNLFTRRRLDNFQPIRLEEMDHLCAAVTEEATIRGGLVSLRSHLHRTSLNNILRISVGKRFEFSTPGRPNPEGDELFANVKEVFELLVAFHLVDLIPGLRYVDPSGVMKRCHKVHAKLRKFFEGEMEEHERRLTSAHLAKGSSKDNGTAVEVAQDFCDALLTAEGEDRLGRIEIIAVLQDMLFGGSDTSSAATEWALLELIRHPEKMTRLQAEVDSVLGLPGEAEGGSGKDTNLEALLLKLPYLSAVVKESFRLHTVGPFMIPHMTSEPVVLGGGKYHVPAGTMIQINAWAISHDPAVWPRPFEFEPERFLNLENIDFKGSDFSFFPFGSGRRMCPGYVLGSTMVYLMLAHLVHSFDWAAGPQGLDTTEKFGLSILPLKSVEAIATPRF